MTVSFEDFATTIATEENFPQKSVTMRNFLIKYPHWISTDKPWYELRYRAWAICYSRTGWEYHFNGVTGEGKSLAEAKSDHHVKYQEQLS